VASAGPHTNNLHVAPQQHLISKFLQAGCSSWCPTNSVEAPKAIFVIKQKMTESYQSVGDVGGHLVDSMSINSVLPGERA